MITASSLSATTETTEQFVLFEYMYRDGGNFKANGSVVLVGSLSELQEKSIRNAFECDGLFIAEQIDLPPLYEKLYNWSNGPISLDHCWHEFVGMARNPSLSARNEIEIWGNASDFWQIVTQVRTWDGSLSPHYLGVQAARN